MLRPFQPPTAAQAAEAALAAELPAVAGLGPAGAATQADVDAFLRGLPGAAAPPPDFAEFDSIYAAQRPQLPGMPPPGAALPQMAAQGRAAAAPMLQVQLKAVGRVGCNVLLFEQGGFMQRVALEPPCSSSTSHCALPVTSATLQAFLDSSKARAPFQPGMVAPPPPGAALSLADQCRVRNRSTIMARQLFAEQGPAFAGGGLGEGCLIVCSGCHGEPDGRVSARWL